VAQPVPVGAASAAVASPPVAAPPPLRSSRSFSAAVMFAEGPLAGAGEQPSGRAATTARRAVSTIGRRDCLCIEEFAR